MRFLTSALVPGCLLLAGCGHAATDGESRDLRARLDAGEHARVEMSRKLEELDNRVFLLTDQVESQKVALSQKSGEPRLPVVTLSPHSPLASISSLPSLGDVGEPPPAAATPRDPDEPLIDPPVPISATPRRRITLEGHAMPWLGDGDSGSSEAGATPRRSKRTSLISSSTTTDAAGPGKSAHLEAHAGSGAEAPAGDGGEPTALYRAAYGKLKAGQPAEAADELRAFVQRFPRHDLADNAQYWLGETFYARGAYHEAIPEFRAVVRRWPAGNKAPDALLKLGYSHLALGEAHEGKEVLTEVADHYPRTEAAQLASKRLAELPAENKK